MLASCPVDGGDTKGNDVEEVEPQTRLQVVVQPPKDKKIWVPKSPPQNKQPNDLHNQPQNQNLKIQDAPQNEEPNDPKNQEFNSIQNQVMYFQDGPLNNDFVVDQVMSIGEESDIQNLDSPLQQIVASAEPLQKLKEIEKEGIDCGGIAYTFLSNAEISIAASTVRPKFLTSV
ncbi:hypothetical protein ACH5RR_031898 [Cinchona calisaya]|uniref:Uncharacterized protein n=1 Tax=Cinchona calisaya TaxID=153742 RepID=A0ABD2YIH3_9GENT